MGWRRIDERFDGSRFAPDDILSKPEAYAYVIYAQYNGADDHDEEDEDPMQTRPLVMVPVKDNIMARKKDSLFGLFMHDWLGHDPSEREIADVRAALFAPYRPEGADGNRHA